MIDSIKAYAKINLHLEVLNKRPDGYHNICSIMAKVDIFDLLQLKQCDICTPNATNVVIDCEGGTNAHVLRDLPIETNTISKAVHCYCKYAQIGLNVAISIVKNIPSGAGMGGGSADAAAVLHMLNNYCKHLDPEKLSTIASEIGADVPFCLNGPIALCEGIGDCITPLPPIHLPKYILIVYDGIHCNTKAAYTALGRTEQQKPSQRDLIYYLWNTNQVPLLLKSFKNDFQETIFNTYKRLRYIYDSLMSYNSELVQLTGSGSAIFALFFDEKIAKRVYNDIKCNFQQVFLTQLLL